MMYYGLIALSTLLFGLQFLFNKKYQQKEGNSLEKAVLFALGTAIVGGLAMLILNSLKIEYTPLSFLCGGMSAIIGILFTYCSVVAMGKVNLSLYSLLSMLGGMLLPFLFGIIFQGEPLTMPKIISMVIISVSLAIGVDFKLDGKTLLVCLEVFCLNGLNGVVSAIHQSNPQNIVSAEGFMLLKNLITVGCCVLLFPFLKLKKCKLNVPVQSCVNMGLFGLICTVANMLLLITLLHVDTSVQYPMVTGGTVIVATLLCLVNGEKITWQNLVSCALALIGTLFLL